MPAQIGQFLNNESYIGLALHLMEPGRLDTGPVLLKETFALQADS